MTFDIKHAKVSAKPDVPDTSLVRPEAWNAAHKIVVSAGVVGRKAGVGEGAAEMLPIYVDAYGTTKFDMKGSLQMPSGTVAQRPIVPQGGMIRYNSDSGRIEVFQSGIWTSLVVVPDAVVPPGTIIYTFAAGASPGWIVAYGGIGNAGSGASNRANLDTLPLYKILWEGYVNAFAPVTGGRGTVAEEDFFANKVMQLPDIREAVLAASGDLGGSASNNRLMSGPTGGFGAAVSKGTFAGNKGNVLTVAQLAKHTHTVPASLVTGGDVQTGIGALKLTSTPTSETGNDEAHNNVQPTLLLNAMIKL